MSSAASGTVRVSVASRSSVASSAPLLGEELEGDAADSYVASAFSAAGRRQA